MCVFTAASRWQRYNIHGTEASGGTRLMPGRLPSPLAGPGVRADAVSAEQSRIRVVAILSSPSQRSSV